MLAPRARIGIAYLLQSYRAEIVPIDGEWWRRASGKRHSSAVGFSLGRIVRKSQPIEKAGETEVPKVFIYGKALPRATNRR